MRRDRNEWKTIWFYFRYIFQGKRVGRIYRVFSSIDIHSIYRWSGRNTAYSDTRHYNRRQMMYRQSSIYGYSMTNYLRQIHLWRYYSDRRFRFCLLNVRLLFARVQSRWKELTNNISATCEQQSRLCSWSGCFVILAIHRLTWSISRQSNRGV